MNQTQVNNFLKCFLQIDGPVSHLTSRDDHDHDHDHEHDDDDHDDHHDHHDHDDDEGSVLIAKVTAMVVLCCASAMCGSIPFLLNRWFRWTENQTNARSAIVVKCLLYFGGGVLLATTFLHLLPEVREVVNELIECKLIPDLPFQLAELLMCCGFFLMYFIEEAIHSYVHRNQSQDDGAPAAFERGHSIRNSHLLRPATAPSAHTTSGSSSSSSSGTLSVQDLIHGDHEQQKYQEANVTSQPPPYTEQQQQQQQHNHNNHHHQHHNDHQHNGHGHGHSHFPTQSSTGDSNDVVTSSLRGLFIVLALSLHELFEGMAIGLESTASSVWFMFAAVSAHKLVLAFCVGVELIVARTRLALAACYVLTFAVVSPLGIGIGILINHTQSNDGPSLESAILQGFACGTLIYVVFFEILSKNRSGLRAYIAFFGGFIVMFGLQQLATIGGGHGHSHSHSCPAAATTTDDHSLETKSGTELDGHHHLHHHHGHNHEEEIEESQRSYEQKLQFLHQLTQKVLGAHATKTE